MPLHVSALVGHLQVLPEDNTLLARALFLWTTKHTKQDLKGSKHEKEHE
jgi:hypothetical protein